ncbi:MAG: hypothetical protein ACXABO_16175 [Promethearchaeota archaeon]
MKRGPVCYIYYTIKNKRKAKADNTNLSHNIIEDDQIQQAMNIEP